MKNFARLFTELDETNKTLEKLAAIRKYFAAASDTDKMVMLALFTGKRPRRQINSTLMKQWAMELANIPEWLFEESYHVVGDMGETISLLLPRNDNSSDKSLTAWMDEIRQLGAMDDAEKKRWLVDAWMQLNAQERFVFNKLLGGSFRVGVSQQLVVKALGELTGMDAPVLAHRLMGHWQPENYTYAQLTAPEGMTDDASRPYPFYLAYPVQETSEKQVSPEELQQLLGNASDWQAEWKWDGIRAQLIRRSGLNFIWSRGEELSTDKFPELHPFMEMLPDGTVLDGEIVVWKNECIQPFNLLQTRIGRKNLPKKLLADCPVGFIAYDCLELDGEDIRAKSQSERRAELEKLQVKTAYPEFFRISPLVQFESWADLSEQRKKSRDMLAEGFMLKRKAATYQTGRKRGDWWKWKIDPLSVDAVMIYAQKGHGRRAELYTDYTFAVWDKDKLVPFAKAYSGLTDAEIRKVDYFIKRNTIEKFGPVRTVKPELVFEIGFEGINESKRHKSGIALRFPRILRWRTDKKPAEADSIEALREMLPVQSG
ncbi:MAG: ATP-dependent DNA ligase [Mucilaginibacter polytrichastri]|nr:ATP-dependent DNA ligase [Mucilaginibacter polytrichastri]